MAVSVASWITYAAARGLTVANNAAASQALVRATDYITYTYVARFLPGYGPTSPYVDEATYEAAGYELSKPGFFTKTYTPGEQKVLTGIEGINWTIVDGKDSSDGWANATRTSTRIAAMLAPYMPGRFAVGLKSVGT